MKRNILVENKWLTLFEDMYDLENGSPCTYYHVSRSDAVMSIALEIEDGLVFTYLVQQYRHPIENKIWQFPLGGIECGSSPIDSARKELQEETGLLAGEFVEHNQFYTDPGFSQQRMHVCITSDILEKQQQRLEESEQGLTVKRVQLSEVRAIASSKAGDAWTLLGYHSIVEYVQSLQGSLSKPSELRDLGES